MAAECKPDKVGSGALEDLPWDSEFFGHRIARIANVPITSESLSAALKAGRQRGTQCVYLFLIPQGDAPLIPEQWGFRLVDVQLRLSAKTHGPTYPLESQGVQVRPGAPEDIASLGRALDILAPWSRFASDRWFGVTAARKMYQTWVRHAATHLEELFAVATHGSERLGFVTGDMSGGPRIGLLGVSRAGLGAGAALVRTALTWARARGPRLFVTTQARNAVALRFYEDQGFRVDDARYVYHCWLEEAESQAGGPG